MKLREGLWLAGPYYIDIDQLGQLRIAGPENHLYYGSVGLKNFDITGLETDQLGQVVLTLVLPAGRWLLHDPVMGHMRKVRSYTEFDNRPTPTFAEVVDETGELSPHEVEMLGMAISFRRRYGQKWYGSQVSWGRSVDARRSDSESGVYISSRSPIRLTIRTQNDLVNKPAVSRVMLDRSPDFSIFGDRQAAIKRLWGRTGAEIAHLVGHNKTSGYEYGTVFPRDWMEAADLAGDDITAEARRYMYRQSLSHIDDTGMGWHENIIGEYDYEERLTLGTLEDSLSELFPQANAAYDQLKHLVRRVQQLYINRNMIDIEPRYMMGLDAIMSARPTADELERLQKTAKYLVEQASENALITFKRLPDFWRRHRHDEEYFKAGNWRDSDNAFQLVHPVLAPYDVNAVFYPAALRSMRGYAAILGLDARLLDRLITKWTAVKQWYRFTAPNQLPAYALALYDIRPAGEAVRYRKLKVTHTDEAYDLFYGQPSEADVVSFAKRLIDPKYFYTKSGPTIVGAGDGYTTEQYHGRVIWTKQTAYAVAGLGRQLERGRNDGWSSGSLDLIRLAIEVTAMASIDAFLKLDTVPELHYDKDGEPHFFNDQPMANGPMNSVQLWSAVGARRIIREYIKAAAHDKRSSH